MGPGVVAAAVEQAKTAPAPGGGIPDEKLETLAPILVRECNAMLYYGLEHGKEVPEGLALAVSEVIAAAPQPGAAALAAIVSVHGQLSRLIAPACGRALVLFEDERLTHPLAHMLGPVRIVRQMTLVGIFALALAVGLSTLSFVETKSIAAGWFTLSGWQAWGVTGFLLAVSGLGASFANLSTINDYIDNATFDPVYEGSYWARLVLGLISGVVLAEILFDIVIDNPGMFAGAISAEVHTGDLAKYIAPAGERVLLAFLGGYATQPVQALLANISDAIGTLLKGRSSPPQPSLPPAQ